MHSVGADNCLDHWMNLPVYDCQSCLGQFCLCVVLRLPVQADSQLSDRLSQSCFASVCLYFEVAGPADEVGVGCCCRDQLLVTVQLQDFLLALHCAAVQTYGGQH